MPIPLVLKSDNVDFYANNSKILTTTNCSETVTTIVNGIINPPYEYDGDVNNYANLDYILTTNGYVKDPNVYDYYSNSRRLPYNGVLYEASNNVTYEYVNTFGTLVSTTTDAYYQVNEDPYNINNIIWNGEKCLMANQFYYLIEYDQFTSYFPRYKYVEFVNKYNEKTNLYTEMKFVTTLNNPLSEVPYTVNIVNRTCAFVFEPMSTLNVLIDTQDKKIFFNSAFKTNPSLGITVENCLYLGKYLNDPTYVSVLLPSKFVFAFIPLDNNYMIISMTNPDTRPANIMTDALGNTYQYLREDEAPQLYSTIFPPS